MKKVDLIRDLVISENDVARSTAEAVPADEGTVSVTRDEQEMDFKRDHAGGEVYSAEGTVTVKDEHSSVAKRKRRMSKENFMKEDLVFRPCIKTLYKERHRLYAQPVKEGSTVVNTHLSGISWPLKFTPQLKVWSLKKARKRAGRF